MLLQGRVRDFPTRFGKMDAFGNPEKSDVGVVGRTESLRSGMKRKQLSLKHPSFPDLSAFTDATIILQHIPLDTRTSLVSRSDPPSKRPTISTLPTNYSLCTYLAFF